MRAQFPHVPWSNVDRGHSSSRNTYNGWLKPLLRGPSPWATSGVHGNMTVLFSLLPLKTHLSLMLNTWYENRASKAYASTNTGSPTYVWLGSPLPTLVQVLIAAHSCFLLGLSGYPQIFLPQVVTFSGFTIKGDPTQPTTKKLQRAKGTGCKSSDEPPSSEERIELGCSPSPLKGLFFSDPAVAQKTSFFL